MARQVRAAYIAHTVSKLITYRVFGPFLFSLGRRYDKADGLFLSMSNHIRDKSTRKEAIWRQQTLLAAFTSSGAKQRINTAAGTVVEEIVNAVKHFADPKEEEGIKIAVKRIVKLAAETWRFARLEREMITAVMPALQDEEHPFTGTGFWTPHDYAHESDSRMASPPDAQPRLLLRLFPVIYREAKHENFHSNDEQNDEGCIYHHGMALYDHAESVVTRAEELKSAGLPSFTTASPTRAEFGKYPPPMVPPPRNPLPPTPAMSEKTASVRARSRPSSPVTAAADNDGAATLIRKRTPPPPPSSIAALNEPVPSMRPVRAYTRPPPGPIDFATPRNIIGMPMPVESIFGPGSSHQHTPSSRAPTTVFIDPVSHRYPAPPLDQHPAFADDSIDPLTTPAHEPTSPPSFPERDPPTPPYSLSNSPPRPETPLFEATDEIESLQSHRPAPTLLRRRSTRTRRPSDELPDVDPRPETTRRTSGYALSHRSAQTNRSERSDKSDLKTRYIHESRSAALKGLYPNYPSPHVGGVKTPKEGGLRGEPFKKKEKEGREREREREREKDRDGAEPSRQRSNSVADNGTWDTNSTLSSLETNTQFSVN